MKKNMGIVDRIVRAIIAIIIGYLYFAGTLTGILGIILLIVAIIFLLTSLMSWCPLYLPFGIKTCKAEKNIGLTGETDQG